MRRQAWRDERRWVIFGLVASVLGLVGFLGPWSTDLIDLGVYRMGADALLRGDDIYKVAQPLTGLVFTYPVFAAVVFIPFALMPVMAARVVMTIGSFAGIFVLVHLSVLWFRRATGRSEERLLRWSIPLSVVCLGAHPVWDTLNFGQVNLILAAIVLLDVFPVVPARRRGYLVGIAAGIKLVPGLFIFYFLVTGQRRAALTSILTAAATVVVGFILAPGPSWDFWTKYASSPERTGAVYYATNQSILGATSRLLRDPDPPRALTTGLAIVVVVLALYSARRLYRDGDRLTAITVVGVASLLASPISWSHHWVWMIPALATLAVWASNQPSVRNWRWWVFGFATAIMVAGPIYFAPKGGDRELHYNVLQQIWGNVYCLAGLVYVGWALLRAVQTADRRPVASSVSASAV